MGQEKGGDYICLCFRKQVGGKERGSERDRDREKGAMGVKESVRER